MTKECKTARNVVLIPAIILVTLLVFLSSCGSNSYLPCAAYASAEVKTK